MARIDPVLTRVLAPGGFRVPQHRSSRGAYAQYRYDAADEVLAALGVDVGALVGLRVLEVGCGLGALTQRLGELRADVIGIDQNQDAIAAGGDAFPAARLELADSTELPFEDRTFDMIVSNDVFEHLVDLSGALREWRRVLVPGGVARVATVQWRSRLGSHAYD